MTELIQKIDIKKKSKTEKEKQKELGATGFKEQYTDQITVLPVLSLFFCFLFLNELPHIYLQVYCTIIYL